MGAKRGVVRLQLTTQAKQNLDDLCERRGMTQIDALSRMVEWFVLQDEVIQAQVLGLMSEENLAELAPGLLERLAKAKKAKDNKAG
ncbi:hypothetical protein KW782_01565 [Candidatus Parcubacteria bacterium]|nr:hypothetical protein [Candidatus Parcubacteria bacterium]